MMYPIKLCILCVILKYDVSKAFPQNWPSSSNKNEGFDWKQKDSENQNFDWKQSSGQSSAWGSDDDLESISSKVLEKYQVN